MYHALMHVFIKIKTYKTNDKTNADNSIDCIAFEDNRLAVTIKY